MLLQIWRNPYFKQDLTHMLPEITLTFPNGITFVLIYIEGGDFMMGDEVGDLWDACRPVHPVRVSSFYMSKYPVTQRLWETVMKSNPSRFKGENRPVETVSWEDAERFIRKLNQIMVDSPREIPGRLRLPTEAEWEYAARGGCYSQRHQQAGDDYLYAGSDRLKQVGWYRENSNDETHENGLMLANELGLHDLSGNVWEWCADRFEEDYYQKCNEKGLMTDPAGPPKGDDRVVRGGSYFDYAVNCLVANRLRLTPDNRDNFIGFRLVLSLQSVG